MPFSEIPRKSTESESSLRHRAEDSLNKAGFSGVVKEEG